MKGDHLILADEPKKCQGRCLRNLRFATCTAYDADIFRVVHAACNIKTLLTSVVLHAMDARQCSGTRRSPQRFSEELKAVFCTSHYADFSSSVSKVPAQ